MPGRARPLVGIMLSAITILTASLSVTSTVKAGGLPLPEPDYTDYCGDAKFMARVPDACRRINPPAQMPSQFLVNDHRELLVYYQKLDHVCQYSGSNITDRAGCQDMPENATQHLDIYLCGGICRQKPPGSQTFEASWCSADGKQFYQVTYVGYWKFETTFVDGCAKVTSSKVVNISTTQENRACTVTGKCSKAPPPTGCKQVCPLGGCDERTCTPLAGYSPECCGHTGGTEHMHVQLKGHTVQQAYYHCSGEGKCVHSTTGKGTPSLAKCLLSCTAPGPSPPVAYKCQYGQCIPSARGTDLANCQEECGPDTKYHVP